MRMTGAFSRLWNIVVSESLMSAIIPYFREVWGDSNPEEIVLTSSCIFLHPTRGMYKLIPMTNHDPVFVHGSIYTRDEFQAMPWGETVSAFYSMDDTFVAFNFPPDHVGNHHEVFMTKIDGEKYVLRLQRWSRRMLVALQQRTCALWMSQHPRLGADSLLRRVDKEIIWKIHALC